MITCEIENEWQRNKILNQMMWQDMWNINRGKWYGKLNIKTDWNMRDDMLNIDDAI